MPMGCDYGDTCPAEPIDNDRDSDWELDKEKLKEDIRKSAGFGATAVSGLSNSIGQDGANLEALGGPGRAYG